MLQALKQLAKEIEALEYFVSEESREKVPQEVKRFCSKIGTELRDLEKGDPWSIRAKFFISIMQEAVRKGMREADLPIVLWKQCVEQRDRSQNLATRHLFQLHESSPHVDLTNEEGDILNFY